MLYYQYDDRPTGTEEHIRDLARRYRVAYAETPTDRLAHHITRLAGDMVELNEIERLLIGLQRAGHLSRPEMILLQARKSCFDAPRAPLSFCNKIGTRPLCCDVRDHGEYWRVSGPSPGDPGVSQTARPKRDISCLWGQ
jgi:hypothetical protein